MQANVDTNPKDHEQRMTILDSKITQTSKSVEILSKKCHGFGKDLFKRLDTTLDAKFETLLAKINGVSAKRGKGRGRPEQAENVAPPFVAGSEKAPEQQRSKRARAQRDKQQPEPPDQPVVSRRGRSMVRAHPYQVANLRHGCTG